MVSAGIGFSPCTGWAERVPDYSGRPTRALRDSSLVLIGDTQQTGLWEFWRERNSGIQLTVFQRIASEEPAFVIHLGDLVYQGSSTRHWRDFDRFAAVIRERQIPVWPILGNHDYYGDNEGALNNFFSRFPQLRRSMWTSFRFGPLGVILLNSNFDELTSEQRLAQSAWYRSTLDSMSREGDSVRLILVACHHPPFTNSRVISDSREVQQEFVAPFLASRKARLFFSGHGHNYERFEQQGRFFMVSGGGGGPRHKLKAHSTHEDLYLGPQGDSISFHYCKVMLQENGVKVQMWRLTQDGQWVLGEEFPVAY